MKYRFASLLAAMFATYVAIQSFSTTGVFGMLSLILSPQFIYLLFAIPLIMFLSGKKVFGPAYLTVLLILTLTPMFSDSEVFEGVVDSLYYLGFEGLSKTIVNLFPFSDVTLQMFAVTSLYLLSLYLDRIEEYERDLHREGYSYTAYPTVAILIVMLFAFYHLMPVLFGLKTYGEFIYGLTAVFLLVVAIGVIWWSR